MNFFRPLVTGVAALATLSMAHAATVVVNGNDDLYNATGLTYDGAAPASINVTGLTSISFAVSAGATVTVNSGSGTNYNDADGVGSASGEFNSGTSSISAITSPTAGYIAGVFLSASPAASAPAALNFDGSGATSFASLSPLLQQAFFVGDGLTGDGTGAVQTFYVPTGATTLYLGLTDACGYSGGPSCYDDNLGSFTVTATGVGGTVAAIPEPGTYALLFAGLGVIGVVARRRKVVQA